MKISFILSSLWLSGGVRVIIEIANGLVVRGHDVCLVVPSGTIDQDVLPFIKPSIPINQSSYILSRGKKSSPFHLARLALSLAQAVPVSDYIISTHAPTTVPGFIATHVLNRGISLWFYQDYIEMFEGKTIEPWLVRNAMRWHKMAIVVSSDSLAELQRFTKQRIVNVSEGISDAEYFHPLTNFVNPDNKICPILFLGDMRPRKGLSDFLLAAEQVYAMIPEIRLWIVSKDQCRIESKVPYDFIYRPSRQELAFRYAKCNLFVSASWWESFGIPPLEAMACGAPVVLTDSRGVRDYAVHGENCLMVPPRDPTALAKAMIAVLQNPYWSEKFHQTGPQTAAEFTWEKSVDRFENALNEMRG